jgi:predicted transcriptional regulator
MSSSGPGNIQAWSSCTWPSCNNALAAEEFASPARDWRGLDRLAVSVRRSIRPDHLVCSVCGKPQKMLKRHVAVRHEMTPAGYRERFGLKSDYPMAAPNYAQQRRDFALRAGLGRPKKPAPRGRKSSGRTQKAEPSAPATA